MFALKLLQILLLAFFQQAQNPKPAQPQAPAAPSSFRISGRVIDAITGQPLVRASVSINVSASAGARVPLDSGRTKLTDPEGRLDRKSTRLNSSHGYISYAVFCLKKKKTYRVMSTATTLDTSS